MTENVNEKPAPGVTFLVHPEPDPVHVPGDPLGRSYTPDHWRAR